MGKTVGRIDLKGLSKIGDCRWLLSAAEKRKPRRLANGRQGFRHIRGVTAPISDFQQVPSPPRIEGQCNARRKILRRTRSRAARENMDSNRRKFVTSRVARQEPQKQLMPRRGEPRQNG